MTIKTYYNCKLILLTDKQARIEITRTLKHFLIRLWFENSGVNGYNIRMFDRLQLCCDDMCDQKFCEDVIGRTHKGSCYPQRALRGICGSYVTICA